MTTKNQTSIEKPAIVDDVKPIEKPAIVDVDFITHNQHTNVYSMKNIYDAKNPSHITLIFDRVLTAQKCILFSCKNTIFSIPFADILECHLTPIQKKLSPVYSMRQMKKHFEKYPTHEHNPTDDDMKTMLFTV